MGSSVKLNW